MTVRVLTDAIHADLLESLYLTLEDRLGYEVYTPHGLDWFEAGIWQFEKANLGDAVALQFLEPWHGDTPNHVHGHDCWCGPNDEHVVRGSDPAASAWWERPGTTHPRRTLRRLTLEQARDLRPDLIISTLAENDTGWATFAREIGAHMGVQVGNQGQQCNWMAAEFALLSTTTPGFTPWMPHVYYHQEFSLADFAADGGALALPDRVGTWVQCPTTSPGYDRFRELAARTGLEWRWFGHCGEADEYHGGNSPNTPEVAARMHEARVAWHWKEWSDGYGHVIHNLAAIGRPLLVTSAYYADKLAGPLLVEGVTSWDLRHHTNDELVRIISRLVSDDDHWRRVCLDTAQRFREVVSFDEEADAIRGMLEGVLSDRLVAA